MTLNSFGCKTRQETMCGSFTIDLVFYYLSFRACPKRKADPILFFQQSINYFIEVFN